MLNATGDVVRPSEVDILISLALDGISNMFDSERNLFCHRVVRHDGGIRKEGVSPRYTIMCLLGLNRAVASGLKCPIDARRAFTALISQSDWMDNLGNFGLYLWLLAMDSSLDIDRFLSQDAIDLALRKYSAENCRTMEIAWFLAGLAHLQLTSISDLRRIEGVALETYDLLLRSRGPEGLFGHQAPLKRANKIRAWMGSFADQVYPIYALSKFGQAFDRSDALQDATRCADAICELQGPMGEWWWHYDSREKRVAGKYPVYSVHQDAMAPMALFALSEAVGTDFSVPIFKGLEWISGNNELGTDLRDFSNNLVWRSVYQTRPWSTINQILRVTGLKEWPAHVQVLYEDRPYHLGWVLYAFSNPRTLPHR